MKTSLYGHALSVRCHKDRSKDQNFSLIVVINLLNRCKWMLWSNLMPPRRRPRTQTDSEPCGAPSCNRLVTNHSGGVQCSECPTWFHIRCGGFSRAVHNPEHWQCPLSSSTGLTRAREPPNHHGITRKLQSG